MQERLQSIRARLQELLRLDPDFELFGADSHRYQLAPPLPEEEIRAFETLHGIQLPEDYRAFLLQIGSSGAGPFYGLKPLGDAEHLDEPSVDVFSSSFPLREWFDLRSPHNLSDAQVFSNRWVGGTLCLSHVGCGMFDLLVVSGDERGHIWEDARCNDYGIFPLALNREGVGKSQEDAQLFTIAETQTERTSFLDWYEWWLDWSVEEAKML